MSGLVVGDRVVYLKKNADAVVAKILGDSVLIEFRKDRRAVVHVSQVAKR